MAQSALTGIQSIPASQTVTVNGATVEYTLSGTEPPIIVLLNGAGGPIHGWYKIYAALEQMGTVLAYNRAGIGRSEKPNVPQTGDVVVETLRGLLTTLNLEPPYVLVGHSIGGLFANLFARKHPDLVAGVVLLDATAPDDIVHLKSEKSVVQRVMEGALKLVLPKDEYGEVNHALVTASQFEQAPPFPDVPLIVLTGGKPSRLMSKKIREIRAKNQRALAAISSRGRQMFAPRSGHFPQFSEAEVVVGSIRKVLSACDADV
jgi:pimeloyl-ACP methyl ester carboxylesterase